MQLLGRSDPSTDDVETIAQRWRFYIESYVLVCGLYSAAHGRRILTWFSQTHPTEGVRREVKNPFLKRYV
jgi:hypothetical protein